MKKKIEPVSSTSSLEPLAAVEPLPVAKESVIRFTVDLPESLHRKLSILAAQQGRKKVELVREWMEQALKDVQS